jgi:2-polyprenyl-3-methyl-5-hydroxy-6-metoxy-1,4-benzoquinol methylase
MCAKTKAELLKLTEELPEDGFFLEHSRQRELTYIERSYSRWLEILALVQERLPNLPTRSCLDVGVSPLTFLLAGHFRKVTGLDLTGALRSRCEQAGISHREGGVTSDSSLLGMDKVDCVFCLEVLEHLHANPVKALSRLHAVLQPGGLLVLSTPNMMCLANRVLMLLNGRLHHFTYPPFSLEDPAHGFAHDRIYMPTELRSYFEAAGFHRVETRYQLHVDDKAQEGRPPLSRLVSPVPALIKRTIPSLRDGIIMLGRA